MTAGEWKVGHLAPKGTEFSGYFRDVQHGPDWVVCEWVLPDLIEVPYRFIDTAGSPGQYGSRNDAPRRKLTNAEIERLVKE